MKAKRHKKKHLRLPVREERYVFPAKGEDWAPNYPDGRIKVILVTWPDGATRVAVWGYDDLGMEIDFPRGHRLEARDLYLSIPQYVSFAWLTEVGLKPA